MRPGPVADQDRVAPTAITAVIIATPAHIAGMDYAASSAGAGGTLTKAPRRLLLLAPEDLHST
jgi:hypothetical protein